MEKIRYWLRSVQCQSVFELLNTIWKTGIIFTLNNNIYSVRWLALGFINEKRVVLIKRFDSDQGSDQWSLFLNLKNLKSVILR